MRLTLCTLFNMNYHFLNTYYYCVHFSNYIVLFFVIFAWGRTSASREQRWRARAARRCTHTHAQTPLWWRVLMRSNKDGNDPVLFPSLFLSLLRSLSFFHAFPSSLARVWHTAVGLCGASMKSEILLLFWHFMDFFRPVRKSCSIKWKQQGRKYVAHLIFISRLKYWCT